jgi:hypothetical protein
MRPLHYAQRRPWPIACGRPGAPFSAVCVCVCVYVCVRACVLQGTPGALVPQHFRQSTASATVTVYEGFLPEVAVGAVGGLIRVNPQDRPRLFATSVAPPDGDPSRVTYSWAVGAVQDGGQVAGIPTPAVLLTPPSQVRDCRIMFVCELGARLWVQWSL